MSSKIIIFSYKTVLTFIILCILKPLSVTKYINCKSSVVHTIILLLLQNTWSMYKVKTDYML